MEVFEVKGISEDSKGVVSFGWKVGSKKRRGKEAEELEKAVRGLVPRKKAGAKGRG